MLQKWRSQGDRHSPAFSWSMEVSIFSVASADFGLFSRCTSKFASFNLKQLHVLSENKVSLDNFTWRPPFPSSPPVSGFSLNGAHLVLLTACQGQPIEGVCSKTRTYPKQLRIRFSPYVVFGGKCFSPKPLKPKP